jgi:hypothetical protein
MSCRIVTAGPYGCSKPRYRSIDSSRATRPDSTNCSTAAAVMVLLIEYAIIVVAASTGT